MYRRTSKSQKQTTQHSSQLTLKCRQVKRTGLDSKGGHSNGWLCQTAINNLRECQLYTTYNNNQIQNDKALLCWLFITFTQGVMKIYTAVKRAYE